MASNINEISALVDLCANVGATGIHIEPLLAQVGSTALDDHYDRENLGNVRSEEVSKALAHAAKRAKDSGITLASRLLTASQYDYVKEVDAEPISRWTCSEPWASIWVTSSGEVRTCCINDTSFGNLFERGFDDIWNGERFQRFREQHARREIATGCANCIRNGRMRNSTFFRPTQPVTYRPYFDSVPNTNANDPVSLESPRPLATVTDPIPICGVLRAAEPPESFDVMIGHTRVADLGTSAYFDRNRFTISLSIPYLTDGAHVLWIRRAGDSTRGWAHRDVYFWRGNECGDSIAVMRQGVLIAPLHRLTAGNPTLHIDGRAWTAVQWRYGAGSAGRALIAHADFSSLPAGAHDARITLLGYTLRSLRLARLPEETEA